LITGCEQSGVLITQGGRGNLLVNAFVAEEAAVDEIRRNWDLTAELVTAIGEHGLSRSRVGVIGYEVLPHSFAAALHDAYPTLTLEPADAISTGLRLRLSEAEVAMMRHAGATGRRIYDAFVAAAQPGETEGGAIGAALAEAAKIPGCIHWNFLAASGPHADALVRTSQPAWNPAQRYEQGDVVHADCYGFVRGYVYDLARTIVVGGKPTPDQDRAIKGVETAIQAMANQLNPGVTPRQLYAAGRQALADCGLRPVAPAFGHGIGAGFIRPYLFAPGPEVGGSDAERPLTPPCGIAFEIIATDDIGHTVYHEDNYLLLDDGVLCLTD
jgi:Xaa-Pro aminopeptidase